jgi:signal transduction histidine kinase
VPFSLAAVGAVLAVSSGAGVGAATTAVAVYAVAVYAGSSAAWIASGIVVGGAAMAAGTAVLLGAAVVDGGQRVRRSCGGPPARVPRGVNIGNRARYVAALMETSGQLWAERSQHAEHAAAAERARIAREMHDVVAHSLTVMVALVEGATATEDGARARGDGPDPIRVVIADDQQLIRLGFGLVLDAEADIAGVGEAVDGADAVAMCAAL